MSKNNNNPLLSVDMAEVLREIGANLKIEYYTASITLTPEQLEELKSKGVKTDAFGCIMGAFTYYSTMTKEEIMDFLKEAEENDGRLSISFEAADEEHGLNLTTPEAAPNFNKLVQGASKNGVIDADDEQLN